MKKYIKPEMKSKLIELENCILAGSISVPISEDPATGPALSKDSSSPEEDGSSSSSIWGE
ncbi:toxin PIN [Prevotella sp. oral taxon 376]|uniref:toxin PIN n=1 Tax=Prevotella sp. oral taxon 376 TaxID=712466 RepID=UPI000D1F2844|nr:toxin PIN [Prevotella sp. oral taxon 376]PTL33890.1 toxin PIN [Prevotella sp. oral taxon 376]